jgi:transcription antitermination factor NusG
LLNERKIEAFLPLYRASRQWKKSCKVVLELPLFPTYIFVHITSQARRDVLSLPGVHSIVGWSKAPWPIPDCEIEALRRGLHACKIEPHPYLKVGERVLIKSGPMMGVEGILSRQKNNCRVVLTVDAIMRSVAVEVNVDNLVLIDG